MCAGNVPSNYRKGFIYGIQDAGYGSVTYSARTAGYDLRWTTPVTGLMVSMSQGFSQQDYKGELPMGPVTIETSAKNYLSRQTALYLEFARGRWSLDGEYRAAKSLTRIMGPPPLPDRTGQLSPAWFAAGSYRLSKWIEVGAYRSRYKHQVLFDPLVTLTGRGANHVDDTAVTLRLDPKHYWNIKLEGHFIDGFGNPLSARGFYLRYHPQGIKPTINMLVLRTGFVF